jgi:glycosyltransferase involved in cell wall biosynthesis
MESQGISVLEAMRSGLPCVVTAAGGLPETVQDGETGIVVPPGDVAGLASAISALIRDPDLRQRLGSAGRRRYLADYSYSLWESRVRQLHEEMLAASPETGA